MGDTVGVKAESSSLRCFHTRPILGTRSSDYGELVHFVSDVSTASEGRAKTSFVPSEDVLSSVFMTTLAAAAAPVTRTFLFSAVVSFSALLDRRSASGSS